MKKAVPRQIVKLAKEHRVIFSAKAQYELDAEIFEPDDVIHSIVHGKVVKKERDEQGESQYKYTVIGPSYSGRSIYSCGKIVRLFEQAYFIITFHEAR